MFGITDKLRAAGHEVIPFSLAYRQSHETEYADYFAKPPGGADAAWFKDLKLSPFEKAMMLSEVFYNRDAKVKLKTLISDQKVDLVYALQIVNTLYPSVIDACVESRVPVIHRLSDFQYLCANYKFFRDGEICEDCLHGAHYHGLQHRCMKGSLSVSAARVFTMYLDKLRGTRHKIDAFVSPSRIVHDKMIEGGFPRQKMNHIPTFVNLEDKDPKYAPGDYILYAGAIDPFKGVRTLLDAWAAIKNTRGKRLLFAGYSLGEEIDVLKRKIAEQEIKNVEFTEFKHGQELVKLFQDSRCVILPTLWYENIPNTVLEAMAYGKPVLGSDLGGIAEIVDHEESGLLFPPGDSAAMAEALARVIDDDSLVERLGRGARENVACSFSPEQHCEKLFALFDRVVAG